jgi:hypothetical protein
MAAAKTIPVSGGGGGGSGGGSGGTTTTFDPVPGSYSGTNPAPGVGSASFTITASNAVTWNWTSTGNLPSSTVSNGGSTASITLSISAGPTVDKESFITVTVGAKTWNIHLTATGGGSA